MSGKPKPAEAYRLAFCLYAISKEGKDVRQTPDRDNQGGIIMQKIDLDSINSEIITIPALDNSKLSEKEYYRLMYLRKKANNSIYKRKEEEYER